MRNKICPFLCVVLLASCVSNTKYKTLESERLKTEEELKATRTLKANLEKELGLSTQQKAELQAALENMKARKAEAEKRIQEYQSLTKKFQRLVDAGKLSVKTINGRMVVALQTDVLFPSGSAKLSKAGIAALKEITPLLTSIQDRNFQIEGHTDDVPIHTEEFDSNWELASARATNVVKTMILFAMPANRISAASFAETKPIVANDSPDHKKLNRRIEIVVVPDLSGLPGYNELNKLGAD